MISDWQQKALDLFPDLRPDIEEDDASIYTLFFELLPRCEEAHGRGDIEELKKIYSYAAWCSQQEEKELWNAAGVAFYEHLVDHPLMREQIPLWLSVEIFGKVSGLFEWRLGPEEFTLLKTRYMEQHRPAV
ncbi:MAG: hypothetical protein LC772_05745 [Chloroflexi bacterium]|nr:hypothetical protein [Chloroflexota bacterium]